MFCDEGVDSIVTSTISRRYKLFIAFQTLSCFSLFTRLLEHKESQLAVIIVMATKELHLPPAAKEKYSKGAEIAR